MYDLVIIGGGPAGSTAGRKAGQLGLKTLLIEQQKFPRFKACGGGISLRAKNYLDFILPKKIIEKDFFGVKIRYKKLNIEKTYTHKLGSLVDRSIFDKFLLDKAKETGIESHTDKVLEYIEKSNFVEIKTTRGLYRSRYLVIACGHNQSIIGQFRKPDSKNQYGICVMTEIMDNSRKLDNCLALQFNVAKQGYGWIFPYDNHLNIGVGGIASWLNNPKKILADFISENNIMGKYKIHGATIPAGGIKRKIVSDRILACGDAAGFADAFTGEGISYAIRSGQLASKCVAKILENNATTKHYESMCNNELWKQLKYSLVFTNLVNKYPDQIFNTLANNDEMLDKFMEILSGRMDYKQYIFWSLLRLPKFLVKNARQKR